MNAGPDASAGRCAGPPAAGPKPGAEPRPEAWVEVHGDVLFRYAAARVRDDAAAEDLVQETLLAALEAREGFRGDSSERTWLIGILRHKIVDHLRRMARDPLVAGEGLDAPGEGIESMFKQDGTWARPPGAWGADPAALAEREEFWAVLRACLKALPNRLGQVFALRMMDAADPQEVCKALDVSATNLWVMLHRARARLRACLETHWFGGGDPE